MNLPSPVEKTVRFSRCVETLADAWSFVMEYVDKVGPSPQIFISPFTSFSTDLEESTGFEVSVNGMNHIEEA